MPYTVDIVEVPRRTLAVMRFHVRQSEMDSMGERMGAAFGAVAEYLARFDVHPEAPAVAFYEQTPDGFDVSAGFPVHGSIRPGHGIRTLELPQCEAAHTTHLGPYDQLPNAYAALQAGLAERGRVQPGGAAMWEEYWTGPEAPPEEWRTEIYAPLAPG